MKIENEIKLDFDDVLLVPQRSRSASRKLVNLQRQFKFYHSDREWTGIPIMASNMDTIGTLAMSHELSKQNIITCLHKYYGVRKFLELDHLPFAMYTWYSMGIKDVELDNLCELVDKTHVVPNICIDVANGYTEDFINFCAKVRNKFGKKPIIMAGNVCSPEMVQELILHGQADIVKIGIGPGSACTTRLKTGIGYPQLSCVSECAHAAHGRRADAGRLGLVCADGGCRYAGDVSKAFAAGADFVMLGGLLAGTEECEGEWEMGTEVYWNHGTDKPPEVTGTTTKKFLKFYGMSSKKAQEKHGQGLKDYRSSEGRVKKIPYKGPVLDTIKDILGGLRSACAYTGATCLKDFAKTAKFYKVNRTHHDQTI